MTSSRDPLAAQENLFIPAELAETTRLKTKSKRRSSSIAEIKEPEPIQVEPIETLLAEENKIEAAFCEKLTLFNALAEEYAIYPSLGLMIDLVHRALKDKAQHRERFVTRSQEIKQTADMQAAGIELQTYKKYIDTLQRGISRINEIINQLNTAVEKIDKNEKEWGELEIFLNKIKSNESFLSYPQVKRLHDEINELLQKKLKTELRFMSAIENHNLDDIDKIEVEKIYLLYAQEAIVEANQKLNLIVKIQQVFSRDIFNAETDKENFKEMLREVSTYAKGLFGEDEDVLKILQDFAEENKTRANLEIAKGEAQEDILQDNALSIAEKIEKLDATHQEYINEILNANGQVERLLKILKEKIHELSIVDATTFDFMHVIEENVKAYRAAYPNILAIENDFFSYCLSPELTALLLEIAKKIQSDYEMINCHELNIKRHAALRKRENCYKVETIKQAKAKYLQDFEILRMKLNQFHINDLQKIMTTANEKMATVALDECQVKLDLQTFLEKLKNNENKDLIIPFSSWERLADFRIELNKLSFQLVLFHFEKKILARIAKVKTYTYDNEYNNAYQATLDNIKKSNYSEDCWVKLKEDQEAYDVFVKKEKTELVEKLMKRTTFTRPVKEFCVVLHQQMELIKSEPDSLEKTARLTLLGDMKKKIEGIREDFLKRLIGGARESIQEDKFKTDIRQILTEELVTKKGLEKITDIAMKQKIILWLRKLLKPLYRFVNLHIKKKHFFTLFKPSKSEKALAAGAEKASNDFLDPKTIAKPKTPTK